MSYDTAWDMPRINWKQQGSFEVGEVPPTVEPDEGDLVCLPPINRHWLPFVQGALDQMRNPSSWLVADDDAMYTTLMRVYKLKEMFGQWGVCMSLAIRFDSETCQLQQSTDGGTTWTEVDGWSSFVACLPPQTELRFTEGCALEESFDGGSSWENVPGWVENFGGCVQENVPIIGLPPNPGDEEHNQFACSIASYLANEVILNAMSAGVTAIQDDIALLAFGANVLTLIPEFILVKLGYDAITIIYTAIAEGTLSHYEDAIADDALWHAVTCAIYEAILTDGYVTPGNFSTIIANIEAISYTHSDVITAIVDYLNSLGAVGLAQLSQRAGLLVGASCDCGTGAWCTWWQAGELDMCNGDWVGIVSSGGGVSTCSGGVFNSTFNGSSSWIRVRADLPFPRTITAVRVDYTGGALDVFSWYFYDASGTLITTRGSTNCIVPTCGAAILGVSRIEVEHGAGNSGFAIGSLKVGGPDSGSPWGVDNGVCD